jgi:hypothetical protein
MLIVVGLLAIGVAACGDATTRERAGEIVTPMEEEQIINAVQAYYRRTPDLPVMNYTVEAVEGSWARVSVAPAGTDTAGGSVDVIYLQNHLESNIQAPAVTPIVLPGNNADANVPGWVIIAGPQVHFSEAELDNAGVPPAIRRPNDG